MKALVIGGTQFVGLRLVWQLHREGHDVTVLNRGLKKANLPEGTKKIICDRKEPESLRAMLKSTEWDAVFDIIAFEPQDVEPLIEILAGNVGRFVFVSSGAVYRAVDVFPWKEHFALVEDDTQGEYGWGKAETERLLFEAHARDGFPVSIIRPGYLYGPHNNVYRESLFFDRALAQRPILVPGDGNNLTQFGYVDDLAALLILAATKPQALGEAFNFAGEYSYLMTDYLEHIFEAVGQRSPIVYFDPASLGVSSSEIGHVFPYRWRAHTVRDTSKARSVLGYEEQTSLGDGLKECFRWYNRARIRKTDIDFGLEDRIIEMVAGTGR